MNRIQFEDEDISLLDLMTFMLRNWYLLLLGFIIGAGSLGAYTYTKPDTYTAYASIFIQSETTSITSLADIQIGTALSVDFIELATSKAVLDTVREDIEDAMHITLTRKQIKTMTDIDNIDKSRLLKFTVTSTDQKLSKKVAEGMAKATAKQVSEIMKTDEPTMVDHAELEEANAKSLVKMTVAGGMAGFFLIAMLLLIPYLRNDKVVNEEDVSKYLGTNIVGVISMDKSVNYRRRK